MTNESRTIGAIVYNRYDAISVCIGIGMHDSWFSEPRWRRAFWCAASMFAHGRDIDVLTLRDEIVTRNSDLNPTDVLDELDSALESCPVPSNIATYADGVRLEHLQRVAAGLGAWTEDRLADANVLDMDETIQDIAGQWADAGLRREQQQTTLALGTELIDSWEHPKAGDRRIPWPLTKMNRHMAPVTDEVIMIAARESVGKTAFILQWLIKLATNGIRGSLASLESKRRRIIPRMISSVAQVNTLRLRRGEGTTEEFTAARNALGVIEKLPIEIADNSMTADQLYAFGRVEKAKGSKILMIDNMKHIRLTGKYESTVAAFRERSDRCKRLRDDLDMPVVVLHHLSKEFDVAWSDDIKRDMDILMYMTENEALSEKPSDANHGFSRCVVDLDIKKNRDGEKGYSMQVNFDQPVQTFREREVVAEAVED